MGYSQSRRKKAEEKSRLRKLKKELISTPINITSVFITLNEADNIQRLAQSLRGFSNRNVIVDTGSTDNTVAMAEKHGFEVYHMEWPNHFSEARNKAVELAQCDNDHWIAMFDADEVLKNGVLLKRDLKLMPPDKDIVAIYHKTGVGHRFHRNCIWRPGSAKWQFRVHEHLLSNEGKPAVTLNYEVHHPDDIGTEHDKKNVLEMLAADAEEFHENPTRQYYYGRQLYYEGRLDAIPILQHCFEISKWDAEAAMCLIFCGQLYEGKMKTNVDQDEFIRCKKKALDFYRASMVKYPRLRASFAGILRVCEDNQEIVRAAMACLQIKESTYFDDTPQFFSQDYDEYLKKLIKETAERQIEINERPVVVGRKE